MPKIIFLNGPPRSGKDSLGRYLALTAPWIRLYKLISPAETFVRTAWGLSREEFYKLREAEKNEPQTMFRGQSLREVFIAFSEQFMKPTFGDAIFGHLAVRRLGPLSETEIIVITDSGFASEAEPLADLVGPENTIKVELEREGCSFEGDSRSYWPPLPGMSSVRIRNEGTLEDFCRTAKCILEPVLTEPGPIVGMRLSTDD